MKKLLITLLLISPASFADWGDVYYCEETTSTHTSLYGDKQNYRLGKFKFRLSESKRAMVFGVDGFFVGKDVKLRPEEYKPSLEEWYGYDEYGSYYFNEGYFVYASASHTGVYAISADCEKF
jgi:hypothetical protein